MAPRSSWRGFLTVGALSCGVALHAAASGSERIALHMVNRASGHRLRRQYVDEESGHPVEADAQVKGYEVADGSFVTFEPEEIAALVPRGDKTIAVDTFVPCDSVDDVYLDRPYFLSPVDEAAAEVFTLLARGLAERKVAALGEAVLFRRVRKLLIRPDAESGALLASTLSFDYEVRSAAEAFADVPEVAVTGEMLDLATHIIRTKAGRFDPAAFPDRYEAALAALVRAKAEGKPLPKAPERSEEKVVDLLAALRASAAATGAPGKGKGKTAKAGGGKTGAAKSGAAKPAAANSPAAKRGTSKSGAPRPARQKAG